MDKSATEPGPGVHFVSERDGAAINYEPAFVIAVMGQFSNQASPDQAPLRERRLVDICAQAGPEFPADWDQQACSAAALPAQLAAQYDWAQVRALDISKDELAADFRLELESTHLFTLLFRSEYESFGGEPVALLVVDFPFDHSSADMALLQKLAQLAELSKFTIIASAAATMLGLNPDSESAELQSLSQRFNTRDYEAWRRLRNSKAARHIVMTAAVPGQHAVAASEIACATATALLQGFASTRDWTPPPDDGAGQDKPDPLQASLSELGFLGADAIPALSGGHLQGLMTAAQASVYPLKSRNALAQAETALGTVLIGSLFMRVLWIITRQRIGAFIEFSAIEAELNQCLQTYIDSPSNPRASIKPLPLVEAAVSLAALSGTPGEICMILKFRPNIPGLQLTECATMYSQPIVYEL